MSDNESNTFFRGALLLTIAAFISKLLSAGYRIPLQNITGDIGFYVYQQVYPILGIAMVMALYGFPSAISKMTVELQEKGHGISLKGFYLPILLILFGIGGAVFSFLWLNAHLLAQWVGDPQLATIYRVSAFVFLLIPITAILRGVFQGNNEMKPTAYSQIGEQIIRVGIIILAAVFIAIQDESIYQVGQAAVYASLFGACTAIGILVLFFQKQKPYDKQQAVIPWTYYIRTLISLGVVAVFNHMVLLIIQFADAFTLVPSLMASGMEKMEAITDKGVFDRGQPLLQLGTVLGSSFALAIIPSISKEKLEQKQAQFTHFIQNALLVSFYLSLGATVGLITIFPYANQLLYQNTDGTVYLQILMVGIFLCSIGITAASILQGLGYIKRTAGFIVIAFFVKWVTNQLLVPLLGITGSSIATIISLLVLCILVFIELKRKVPTLHFWKKINLPALTIAVGVMVMYLLFVNYLFSFLTITSRFDLLLYVMFVSVTGGILYLYCLLKGRVFTDEELQMIPFASRFMKLHNGRN
ncbi:putative polysaccharide biosynthesis protein [Oceanobacillus halotolerans]|uniref:putative polysaccharide biosynthesis protein n=1 Tax=Oceanobacillus halotolerans TaxID=2663380 RepID=UPI0013DD6BB4|nr:polysaccharide biosynthesis protein [Oceanobacillus halotolerans]